ncbi:MAG: hypothetical protein KGJ13_07575, partial [Patescibacteria group bacterium]|nr:hypothetical protein [Patescibacteria group bacterium]
LPESLRGPFEDFTKKVNGTDGAEWEGAFKKFLRKEPCWVNGESKSAALTKPEPQPILRFIDTIAIPARRKQFVPKKSYVVNTNPGKHVKIWYVDPDFTAWFGEKAEEPTAEVTLRRHVLVRSSAFAPAMKEVEDAGFVTETTPSQPFSMLEKQPDGPKSKPGPLLTNGYANLFKMIDVNGVARLVNAFWNDVSSGWHVFANDASLSGEWSGGSQLFSGDSRIPSVA